MSPPLPVVLTSTFHTSSASTQIVPSVI